MLDQFFESYFKIVKGITETLIIKMLVIFIITGLIIAVIAKKIS